MAYDIFLGSDFNIFELLFFSGEQYHAPYGHGYGLAQHGKHVAAAPLAHHGATYHSGVHHGVAPHHGGYGYNHHNAGYGHAAAAHGYG